MYTTKGYVYDDENLAFIPAEIYYMENKSIISKYTTNKAEYEKIESVLHEKKEQEYTAINKLLTVAGIAITYDCQLRCNYCSNNSTEHNVFKTDINDIVCFVKYLIKNVKIKRIIDKNSNTLTIYLSGGGEPTYDWDLFCNVVDLIRELCDKENIDCKINLTTNGILNDKQIDYIHKNINSIMVSFDGHPKIQDKNRRFYDKSKTSDIVVNSIRALDGNGSNYSIRSTLWHDELIYFEDMFHYIYDNFKNYGAWSINPVVSAGRAKNYSAAIYEEEIDKFFNTYIKVKNEAISEYGKSNLGLLFITNELCGIICGIPDANSPFLYPNKNIGICVDAADLSPIVGRIEDGKVVFEPNYSKEIFNVYYNRYFECKNCVAFRFCAGGCPVKRMRPNNLASADFECEITKKYYKYIFDKILDGKYVFGWYGKKVHIMELNCDIIQITNESIESKNYINDQTGD